MKLSIVKTSTDAGTDAALAREAQWLRALESIPELEGQVPRLLEEGTRASGRRYLVLSVAAEGMRASETRAFTADHRRFLAALGKVRFRAAEFDASGCCTWLQASLERMSACAPEASDTLEAAYRDCESALLYWTGPYVLSQGDFAPWNIRSLGSQLFVFDWGNARADASPLDDVLHYLMVQRVLSSQAPSAAVLRSAMAEAREFAVQAYPEWSWRAPVIGALTLVYLLGVVVERSLAAGRLDLGNPLVATYWNLVEDRPAWMPAAKVAHSD
ncbi:MAG: phosphotransferase [Betaproteobacteria bacterium]